MKIHLEEGGKQKSISGPRVRECLNVLWHWKLAPVGERAGMRTPILLFLPAETARDLTFFLNTVLRESVSHGCPEHQCLLGTLGIYYRKVPSIMLNVRCASFWVFFLKLVSRISFKALEKCVLYRYLIWLFSSF